MRTPAPIIARGGRDPPVVITMSLGWEESCCCCYQQLGRKVVNVSITTATNHASVAATKASMATKPSSVNIYNQGLVANKQISSYDTSSSMSLCSFTLGNTAITEMPAIKYVNITEQTRGKICTAFSCREYRCFKGKKSTTRCRVGYDYCEMKKTGFNYVAGCSKACKAAKPVCAQGVKAACFQECCPATLKGSCLKLDGKVHVNGAGQVAVFPLLYLLVFMVAHLLSCKASTPLHE